MKPYCFLNGAFVPLSEAAISVYDIGILRGYGIYEAFCTYGGKPFMLNDHLARFRRSAEGLSLHIPMSDNEIEDAVLELIRRNGYQEAILRFILTGGQALGGIEYNETKPTFYMLAEEFVHLPESTFENGSSLITAEHQRQLPQWKTIDYIEAVKLQKKRAEAGAIEILYHVGGQVLEGATSNVFIVKDGVLITPSDNVLHGITRNATITAAKPHFETEERDITLSELLAADEVFITSSFKEVVPIVKVDGAAIGSGAVGPVAKEVLRLFREFAHNHGAQKSGIVVSAPARQ